MIHSPGKRFIANLLLFCILFQSCGGNEYYLYREKQQEIVAQLKRKQLVSSTKCQQERDHSTVEAPVPDPSLLKKWIEPTELTKNSVAQKPLEPMPYVGNVFKHPLSNELPAKQSPPTTVSFSDLFPSSYPEAARSIPKSSSLPTVLSLGSGRKIAFRQLKDHTWQAHVIDLRLGMIEVLPVVCPAGLAVATTLRDLQYLPASSIAHRVHIISTRNAPNASRCVYLGTLGLMGGMPTQDNSVSKEQERLEASRKAVEKWEEAENTKEQEACKEEYKKQQHQEPIECSPKKQQELTQPPEALEEEKAPPADLAVFCRKVPHFTRRPRSVGAPKSHQRASSPIPSQSFQSCEPSNVTAHFLSTYPANLPPTQAANFHRVIAPILQDRLASVDNVLQQRVVAYFESVGSFYPTILREVPVTSWVKESLKLAIRHSTSANELVAARFSEQLAALEQHYANEEVENILFALYQKQYIHQLDLLALCDILSMLPAEGKKALTLLQTPSPTWLLFLKQHWLASCLKSTKKSFSSAEKAWLTEQFIRLGWVPSIVTSFLERLTQETLFSQVKGFLSFVGDTAIAPAELMTAFHSLPVDQEENLLQVWQHQLEGVVLQEKLKKLFPDHFLSINPKIVSLRPICSYASLSSLLDTLLTKEPCRRS